MESPVGEKALSVRKNSELDIIFKEPVAPPVKKRTIKKVLPEESYLCKIAEIIERDFFPDLEKLHAQNDFLNAMENNDIQRLRELYAKYSGSSPYVERNFESPATFDTPEHFTSLADAAAAGNPESSIRSQSSTYSSKSRSSNFSCKSSLSSKKQSLDEFLSTHTSEDNQSFEDIIEHAKKKHRIKYPWLYKGEEEAPENQSKFLELPSMQEQIECNKDGENKRIETWKFVNKNSIMYTPDGVKLTQDEQIEMAKNKMSINHSSTRLHTNPFDEQQNKEVVQGLAKTQAITSACGRIGVDGKEIIMGSTPRVNGFSFVNTPSPAPGVDASPLMTWGQIEGTPFKLDGSDTPLISGPIDVAFKMPEPPKREKLALALADKVCERYRDKKKKAMQAAKQQLQSPNHSRLMSPLSLDRFNSMSPAARKLASQYSPYMSRLHSDKSLQASYSPRRSPNVRATPSPSSSRSTASTPTPTLPSSNIDQMKFNKSMKSK